MKTRTLMSLIVGFFASLLVFGEELAPVVVTAGKRSEDAARIPLSLSVVNAEQLDELSPSTVNEVAYRVPNLHFVSFSAARLSFPYIRGIGSGQGNPAIGTYMDDVPQLSISTSRWDLLSPHQIEVLRGPQGTLYGRNTLGGVILVQSEPPADSFGGSLDYAYASEDHHRVRLRLSGPVSEQGAAFAFDTAYRTRDGYTVNTLTGNDVDGRDAFSGRFELRLAPIADWDVRIGVQAQRDRDGGFALYPLEKLRKRPHQVAYDLEGKAHRDAIAPFLRIERLGEQIDFLSITGYQQWRVVELVDLDFDASPAPFDANQREVVEEQTEFTQEFRWSSADGAELGLPGDIATSWLFGLYGFHSHFIHHRDVSGYGFLPPSTIYPFRARSRAEMNTTGMAAFGQTTLGLSESLDLTLGLRYSYEDVEATEANFGTLAPGTGAFREDFSELLPKIALAWHATDRLTAFASASKGHKAGGFNTWAPDADAVGYEEETSWNYELGIKGTACSNKLRFAATLFHIEWEEMQIFLPAADRDTDFYLANAGASRSRGLELEAAYSLPGGFVLEGSVGFTDAEFTEGYVDPFSGEDIEGNSVHFAPENTWHVGLSKAVDLGDAWVLSARADVHGVGQYAYDPSNKEGQSAYSLTDLSVGVSDGQLDVRLWIHNLFDEAYIPVAFRDNPDSYIGESGAPRTVGVGIGYRF